MYKNILVPMALSRTKDTRTAVDVAEKLVADGGRITALHIMEHIPAYVASYLPGDHAEKRRDHTMDLLKQQLDGHDGVQLAAVNGHAGRAIVDFANEHDCDLIVVASHRPGPGDIILGSTAAWVVRHANCAVHVTR